MNKEEPRLNRAFERIERRFPKVAKVITQLRQPKARIIRVPLGLILILGGIFSFLPILGIWMLPLGLLLLAVDLPFLQHPMNAAMIKGERFWTVWRRKRRDKKKEQ